MNQKYELFISVDKEYFQGNVANILGSFLDYVRNATLQRNIKLCV